MLEAERVAELIFEHFNKHPNRSLGVIAFGEVQQRAIETTLRAMRLKNQQYEHFFNEEKEDAFFIKNLENVQGDERDTIIFSIGYAKDAAGVFRMNFGPLSKSGGERRLNVAITRAKYNVKLVGSILPTDIDVDRVSAEGPKLLRSYIDFAINGIDSLQREATASDNVQHDSPFETAVYDFLDRKGYKLATQVGCSGYRIDMAVKHPTISGQYILGIECDGASYHSAKTARERDRLRQDVLENMGWKIYRIWSTDWIKDPVTEGNRLIKAINDAVKNYGIDEPVSAKMEVNAEDFIALEEKTVSIEDMKNTFDVEKVQHRVGRLTEGNHLIEPIEDAVKNSRIDEPVSAKMEVNAEDFVSLEEKTVSIEDMENTFDVEKVQQGIGDLMEGNRLIDPIEDAVKNCGIDEPVSDKKEANAEDFVSLEEKAFFKGDIEDPYDFEKVKQVREHLHLCRLACFDGKLSEADCLMEIVKCRYPIHYESICEEIAPLFGYFTAGARVKLAVDPLLQQLGNKLIRKGDFYFPAGYTKITPRYNLRKIKHVSSEELAEVMCDILGRYDVLRSVGLTKEFLYDQTAREYHFFRKTRNVILALDEAIELLEKQNRIEIVKGKVILSK